MTGMERERQSKGRLSEEALLRSKRHRSLWRKVDQRLAVYGGQRHGNLDDPLDELVFIVLSAQTEWYLYRMAFQALRPRFPPWARLLPAPHPLLPSPTHTPRLTPS